MSFVTGPLQNLQVLMTGSDIFWKSSNSFPHFLHLYSYMGIHILPQTIVSEAPLQYVQGAYVLDHVPKIKKKENVLKVFYLSESLRSCIGC